MGINRSDKKRERSIAAESLFTDSLELKGHFNISLSGTWVGTLTVQRSFDSGSTWFDVKTFTQNAQEYGYEPEGGIYYRAGVKTGEYTSGTVVVRLSL